MGKYGIGVSRTSRARRKSVGIANVHYIRYERRFLLLATHGFHPFYDDEARNVRDARRTPIKFEGYSISVARGDFHRKEDPNGPAVRDTRWRTRVQIDREWYKGLKAYFLDIAVHRTADALAGELYYLPFEPYAPVRQQLLNLLRYINQRRVAASLEPVSIRAIRLRRRIVKPFEPLPDVESTAAEHAKRAAG
jgi:hypothetical protein